MEGYTQKTKSIKTARGTFPMNIPCGRDNSSGGKMHDTSGDPAPGASQPHATGNATKDGYNKEGSA